MTRDEKLHDKHMQLVDDVNNAGSELDRWIADARLSGFREGLQTMGLDDAGLGWQLMACDQTQMDRGDGDRPMCCGVFLDWEASTKDEVRP